MDQLTDALRDLDPQAPPSRVDLDAVVRRAHRHRRRTRVVLAASALAFAVVAAPLTAGVLRDPGPGGGPAARPPGACEPTAGPADPGPGTDHTDAEQVKRDAAARLRLVTATRLTMVLDGPLRQALPGATLLDAATCAPGFTFRATGAPSAGVGGLPTAAGVRFDAGIVVVDAAGAGHVDVRVERAPAPAGRDCDAGTATTTCEWVVLADGTVTYRAWADHGGGVVWHEVDVYRPDGVHVHLSTDNIGSAGGGAAGGAGGAGGVLATARVVPPLDDGELYSLSRLAELTL